MYYNKWFAGKVCILVLVVSLISVVHSESTWTKLPLSGGKILDLERFPGNPSVILAIAESDGLYRSDDNGARWTKIRSGSFNDIACTANGTAFAADNSGLLKSEDSGQTWTTILSHYTRQVVCQDSLVIADTVSTGFINGYKAEWIISLDHGEHWQVWGGTSSYYSIWFVSFINERERGSFLFHRNGYIYRSDFGRLYRTHKDSLTNWTEIDNSLRTLAVLHLEPSGVAGDTLWSYSRYYDLHPLGGLGGGVFYSIDWGKTWNSIGFDSVFSIVKSKSNLLIGTVEGDLWQYELGTKRKTLLGSFGGSVTAIDQFYLDSGEILVATYGGIYKTVDLGATWQKSDLGFQKNFVNGVQTVLLASGGERIIAATYYGGIVYSDDGGKSWNSAEQKFPISPGLLKVAPSDSSVLYAGHALIYLSTDTGRTWQISQTFSDSVYYYGWYGRCSDLSIDPHDPHHVYVNYFDHSMDSFAGVPIAEGYYQEDSIWQWTYKDWYHLNYPNYLTSHFDPIRNLIWISKPGDIWYEIAPVIFGVNLKSDNILQEITLPEYDDPVIWLVSGQRCYYFNPQTKRFWRSADLGRTWDSTEIVVKDYQYYPDQFIMKPFGQLMEYPDSSQLFLIYPGSGIWISRDYGQTWNSYNEGLADLNAYQIAFSSQNPDWAYLATADGIYRRQLSSTIDEPSSKLCSEFRLFPNYPNPFNSGTAIRFDLPIATDVEIRIYDLRGTLVQTIRKKHLTPGTHTVQWNAGNLSSGIYFYQVHSDQAILTRKCLLIK